MDFYQNLKYICDSNSITVTALLKRLQLSSAYGTNWKKGISPTLEMLIKLSEELDVSIDYLVLGKEASLTPDEQKLVTNFSSLNQTNKIRILERIDTLLDLQDAENKPEIKMITIKHSIYKVSAGKGYWLEDEYWDTKDVPDTPESRKADFCLTIDGNSMEPIYHDKDIVLVKSQDSVDLGQIGIFTIENNGYIKKFGGDRLISLNDEYDDILFSDYASDDIHCNGLVIGRV